MSPASAVYKLSVYSKLFVYAASLVTGEIQEPSKWTGMSRCLFTYLKALLWKHPSLPGRGAQGFLEPLVICHHCPISFPLYSSPCFGHKRNDQGQNCPKTKAGFNPNSGISWITTVHLCQQEREKSMELEAGPDFRITAQMSALSSCCSKV